MIKTLIPFIFVLLWSTGFIGAKYGLPYASTGDFLTIRTLLNILVFVVLVALIKQKALTKAQIGHAMVTGVLIHGAYLGGVFGAIEYGIPAGMTAIIVGLQPLLTAGLSIYLFKASVNKAQWIALFTGLVGLVLVVFSGIAVEQVNLTALSFAVVALLGITLGTLYQKRYCHQQSMLPSVLWQYVASLLVFAPIALMQTSKPIEWHPEFIFALAWLVLALSVASILLLLYMIKEGDAAKVTSYFYLVPPTTALQAWLLFDEQISVYSMMGMVLCAVSVYVVIRRPSTSSG